MTLWKVNRTGVDGSTPGDICNTASVKHAPSPVLFGIVSTSPPCGLNGSLKVINKRKRNSSDFGGKTQKLDAVVEKKIPTNVHFIKLIGQKLSDGSINEIYL